MPQKRILRTVRLSAAWLEILAATHPELTEHGNAWALESLIADKVGLHRPATPAQARKMGAAKRGEQLAGKPALNPAGRKPNINSHSRQTQKAPDSTIDRSENLAQLRN